MNQNLVNSKKPSVIVSMMQGAIVGVVVGGFALLAIYFISKILLA